MKNIVLIGMMGSSKTTSGRRAAKILNLPFIDADIYYTEKYNETIADTFQKHGEKIFRDRESAVIKELAEIYNGEDGKNAVIALGGGAVLRRENMDAVKPGAVVIALYARPEVILERVSRSKNRRPLLKAPDLESVNKIYDERKPLYEKYADAEIDTSFLTLKGTAKKIAAVFGKFYSRLT